MNENLYGILGEGVYVSQKLKEYEKQRNDNAKLVVVLRSLRLKWQKREQSMTKRGQKVLKITDDATSHTCQDLHRIV